MKVRDILRTPVISISRDATICEAVRLLSSTGISEMPVVDSDGCLVGVLSEHDLIKLLLPTYEELADVDGASLDPTLMQSKALAVRNNPVYSVMTENVMTLEEEDTVLKAASIVISRRIRRIPVVRHRKPVGVVSRMDILDAAMRGGL